jgi:mono/diheme cytochrome c family protein
MTPTPSIEPKAEQAPVPVWLFVLLFGLLYLGAVYFDQRSGWFNREVYTPYRTFAQVQAFQPATGGGNLERGRAVYENVCGLCPNTDGKGKPNQAPPFAGSEWALGSPTRMIHIPLTGLTGPVQVDGKEWNLAMPAMGAALSDDDLAAVLTYIRQSWGNKAAAVTPEQVHAVRAKLGNRLQPSTAEELKAIQ